MGRSRKFCQRGSNFGVFFKVGEGREDLSPTLSGPSSARQRNAIKWRFAGMPMNAQHRRLASQLRFFRGSGPACIFVIFQGGGSGPPVPPSGTAHVIL